MSCPATIEFLCLCTCVATVYVGVDVAADGTEGGGAHYPKGGEVADQAVSRIAKQLTQMVEVDEL